MGIETGPPPLEPGQPDASRRLVTLQRVDAGGGGRQLLEADAVLWTAGTKPAGSGDRKLKVCEMADEQNATADIHSESPPA